MNTETQLAYLAGFLDGEGNIRIPTTKSNPGGYLRISATQVDPAPLEMLQRRFGGYVYRRVREGTRPDGFHRQDISDWVLTGPRAAAALLAVMPYLVVKREAARLAVEFAGLVSGLYPRTKLDPWALAERQSYAEALIVRGRADAGPPP